MEPSLKVYWSMRLEKLADKLFQLWQTSPQGNDAPFKKACILVKDLAARDWLKNRLLLDQKSNGRKIIANLEFLLADAFINDWLHALLHAENGKRQAASHPYSPNVMAWRINAILATEASDYPRLEAYIGNDPKAAPLRRFELSQKIAQLFDEYLNHRYQMLASWEQGIVSDNASDDEQWQAGLYQRLLKEAPQSYADDYVQALQINSAQAIANGFTDYSHVFVFDVPAIPWPQQHLFRHLSQSTPVTFFCFNPASIEWIDQPTVKQARKEALELLRKGVLPPEQNINETILDITDPILGSLATAARGSLGALLDMTEGAAVSLDSEAQTHANALQTILGDCPVQLHIAYSQRREVEALQNGLLDFFQKNPAAHPRDVLVLCADWQNYAADIEAVFGLQPSEQGFLPCSIELTPATFSAVISSFSQLLEFRDNRFEASAVMNLLAIPSIHAKAELDNSDLDIVSDLIAKANIHWGIDDNDVAQTIGTPHENHLFTWRRGLDRILCNALLGNIKQNDGIINLPLFNDIRPCGNAEEHRAETAAKLAQFIDHLIVLRQNLRTPHDALKWRGILMAAVENFYEPSTDNAMGLIAIRRAITSVTNNIICADDIRSKYDSGCSPADIDGDVIVAAVNDALASSVLRPPISGDRITFAPLNNTTATPHKLVWVCGLNDGHFPRNVQRSTFDLVSRHPTIMDTTIRDQDSLALLKAVAAARSQLVFSYVGVDAKTNEKRPPSTALSCILDNLPANHAIKFIHPLQAFSPQYFLPASNGHDLPPTFSQANYDAALAIMSRQNLQEEQKVPDNITPFTLTDEGITEISLYEILDFFRQPNKSILKTRLQASVQIPKYLKINDLDTLETTIPYDISTGIALGCNMPDHYGNLLAETGKAPDTEDATSKLRQLSANPSTDIQKLHKRKLNYSKNIELSAADIYAVDIYLQYLKTRPITVSVSSSWNGKPVRIYGNINTLDLKTDDGDVHPSLFLLTSKAEPIHKLQTWLLHVIASAALASQKINSYMIRMDGGPVLALKPMSEDECSHHLQSILDILFQPLPQGIPNMHLAIVPQNDVLPEELYETLIPKGAFLSSAALRKE